MLYLDKSPCPPATMSSLPETAPSKLWSCSSLQQGNEELLASKVEPEDKKSLLLAKKQVGPAPQTYNLLVLLTVQTCATCAEQAACIGVAVRFAWKALAEELALIEMEVQVEDIVF